MLALVTESPDIVISQGAITDATKSLVFQPKGESTWWSEVGQLAEVGEPKLLVEDHPVLRHIDVSTIPFVGAVELSVPDKAQVLVESDTGVPLIFRVSENGKTHVIVNMDPVLSDFYFSAWFPVLVHGTATHLAGREDILLASYRPGDTVPITGSMDDEETEITLPDATKVTQRGKRFGPSNAVGYFELKNGAGTWTVGSSLISDQESAIDNSAVEDSSKPISQGWPLAHLLTVIAVLALGAESLLYQRRKVG